MWFLRNWHNSPSILKKGHRKTKVNVWLPAHTYLFFVLIASSFVACNLSDFVTCHVSSMWCNSISDSNFPVFPSFLQCLSRFFHNCQGGIQKFFLNTLCSTIFIPLQQFTVSFLSITFIHTVNLFCNAISHFSTSLTFHNRHSDHEI